MSTWCWYNWAIPLQARFSYGNGIGRIFGKVQNDRLNYNWKLGSENGAGVLATQSNSYRGSWGYGASAAGGGTLDLTKQP